MCELRSVPVLIGILICSAIARPQCRTGKCIDENKPPFGNDFYFRVNGTTELKEQHVMVTFENRKNYNYILLWCNHHYDGFGKKFAANDPALPVMSPPVSVKIVEIRGCTVPTNGSYYKALKSLNITFKGNESYLMLTELPAQPKLEEDHLDQLPITKLLISANDSQNPTRPKFNFLDKLPNLRVLELKQNMMLEKEAIERLPKGLEKLTLKDTRLSTTESEFGNGSYWLKRLDSLKELQIWENSTRVAGLKIKTDLLQIMVSLPNLKTAKLSSVPLRLPENLEWLNGSNLKLLQLQSCGLVNLPSDLFKGANLTNLDLTNNNLTSLPEDIFTPLKSLTELDLSGNRLIGETLQLVVQPLRRLEVLRANRNPLGSLCGDGIFQGKQGSKLPPSLRVLELGNTNASRICDDWVHSESLMNIILTNNSISYLMYKHLTMLRRVRNRTIKLNLKHNPLRKIRLTEADFNECVQVNPAPSNEGLKRARVHLKLTALSCDCDIYWLRKTLLSCSQLLRMDTDTVSCEPKPSEVEPQFLKYYYPHNITCLYRRSCPTGCTCKRRAFDNAIVMQCADALPPVSQWPPAAPGWPLALHVPPGSLTAVPPVTLVELHAPNNNITYIDNIPSTLRVLNVSNNRIARITSEAADKLLHLGTEVSLAGNPLTCACEDAPAISKLKQANITDWSKMQCADGNYVAGKTTAEMCDDYVLLSALILVGTLLIITLMIVYLKCKLPRIRQFLFDHNICMKYVLGVKDNPDDPMKTHDVFISYSHDDYEYAKKLINRLEERGHSTIEHCRDWLPGVAVTQQIAHSVMSARRTLLLVSDSFANSKWALEEFHAAHAHAMEHGAARVIIVRCKLLAPQQLPIELQVYLYNNTYLDWSDVYFWNKLWRVMPTPRAVPTSGIALLHDEKPSSGRIQAALRANPVSSLKLWGDKEPPLSELVLVPPVPDAASQGHGQNRSQGQASPVIQVTQLQQHRVTQKIQRER